MTSEQTPADAEGEPGKEDLKRKFREALERKQTRQADGSASGDTGDHTKVGGTHGPAHTQRQFRRKSGG